MRNASIAVAEHVLGFLTTKQRADSIIGDLVETAPRKGAAWFWLSIFKIVFWLGWRPLLAFVAAFYCGNWALGGLQSALYAVNVHLPHGPWMPFDVLMGVTTVLCMVLTYATIRYGVRDRVVQLGLIWTGLFNLFLWEWWRPGVLVICLALNFLLIVMSLHKREYRRASATLLATVSIGFVTWLTSMYLTDRWQHFIHPGLWGDAEMRAHPSVAWVGILTYLAAVWISVMSLSRLHKWAAEERV